MKLLKSIYLNRSLYVYGFVVAVLFVAGTYVDFLYSVAKIASMLLLFLLVLDFALLYKNKKGISGKREMAERFSNGDNNEVRLQISNHYAFKVWMQIIDEVPVRFQIRDFSIRKIVLPGKMVKEVYKLRPVERGEYGFGKINVFIKTRIGLAERRYQLGEIQTVAVYPSFHQLKDGNFLSFAELRNRLGLKKIRRLGYNKEFEQIKDYVVGDEIRNINWKATARRNKVMVNQYQDERAQYIYSVIDMGRTMKMPFYGMSLLDYAINSTLALTQIVLKNYDRMGMISYSNKLNSIVPSGNRNNQLPLMLETLYNQQTAFAESSLEPVYTFIKRRVNHRSLFIFFTNFESIYSMERQLNFFLNLNKNHLVLIVSFENTEVVKIANNPVTNTEEVYIKAIAEKSILDKRIFMKELAKYGIQSLLTAPENLTVDTVNKYLEIKARGLI
ncbi:MAG: DUF58 domain-containing protein [Chlorobi bacterium]|nr:DUF58 domain-containing protein [Chlorobiota bacterium]